MSDVRRLWSPGWLGELQSKQGLGEVDLSLIEGAVAAGVKTIWLTQEIWRVDRRAPAPAGS